MVSYGSINKDLHVELHGSLTGITSVKYTCTNSTVHDNSERTHQQQHRTRIKNNIKFMKTSDTLYMYLYSIILLVPLTNFHAQV